MTQQLRTLGVALVALLAGLLPALRFAPPPAPFLLAALAAALGLLGSARSTRSAPARHAPLLLLAAFAAGGAALGALAARDVRADCRAHFPEGAAFSARGVLGAAAVPAARAGGARAPPPLLPLVDATLVARGGPACGAPVRVRLPRAFAAAPGAELALTGRWARMSGPANVSAWPRDPAFAGYLAVDSAATVVPPSFARHPLLLLRGRTDAAIRRLFPRRYPLAGALLLGRREEVDPAVRDAFARSGLVHLLAISGSHVALLAAMLLIVGSAARLPRQVVSLGCIALVAVYLAMIGAPASAVRAGIMLALGLGGVLLQRPSAHLATVSAAALVILALQPMAALDPGFQLSFAGVMGIVAARNLADGRIRAVVRRHPAYRLLGEPLLVSAAAFFATAPIAAHHFGQIAPISILAGLPAIPVTTLALVGIVAAVSVDPIVPPLAALVADGASLALGSLEWLTIAAAEIPFGHAPVHRPAWGRWIVAGLAALAAARLGGALRPVVRSVAAAGVAAAVLLAAAAVPSPGGGGEMEIHFLDVGQGDATAIRTPAGRWVLVDAGPASVDFDAGERRILPFLRARGVRRLEALVLTHPDLDHIGGAPAVLRGVEVGRVVEPGLAVGKDSYAAVLAAVRDRSVPWVAARTGRTITLDGVRFRMLWPDSASLDGAPEANQISVVLAVELDGFRLILTGDADADVERLIAARQGDSVRAAVLKAGHHGSSTSTSAELLAVVRPELVVVSAGRRNRYGHPDPGVLARIQATGTEIARTDLDGTVSLRVRGGVDGAWFRVRH